jgi:hypothetical protein
MNEARLLEESLLRQFRFFDVWGGRPQFPVHLGATLDDQNGYCSLGVQITDGVAQTRDGYVMTLAAGDTLVQFAGRPVFGVGDVWSILQQHATNKTGGGVDVPIPFVVRRHGQLVADKTNYFFNRDYFAVTDSDRVAAVWLGLSDSAFLGAGCFANAGLVTGLRGLANGLQWLAGKLDEKHTPQYLDGPSFDDIRWGCNQRKAMLKQFESGSYNLGAVGGIFFQPTRALVNRVGGRALTQSTAGLVLIEAGELAIWTAVDGSPMRTASELASEIRDAAPLALASGIVQGILR